MSTLTPALGRSAHDLARFSRAFYAQGWMPGTAGNLSIRCPADQALITASGRDKGDLAGTDMVLVGIDTGQPVRPGGLRASAETSIHTAIYRATDAQAVVHVHSPFATAVASRTPTPDTLVLLRLERYELLKGLGLDDPSATELAILPNWPHVPQIGDDLTAHLRQSRDPAPGFLIAHHGITTWGRDLAQARNRAECLEAICQQLVLAPTLPTRPPALAEGEAR